MMKQTTIDCTRRTALGRLGAAATMGGLAVAFAGLPALTNAAQATTPAPAVDAASLVTGQMGSFILKKTPEPLPDIAFVDGDNKPRTLKDWRGRVVLLNLWATWCLPCRKEMPALERLQGALGSADFEVVTLSIDRGGIPASRKFLDQIKVEKLTLYVDPTTKLNTQLRVLGLPATLLVGRDGREIGRLLGPAEWDSEDAKRLITAFLK